MTNKNMVRELMDDNPEDRMKMHEAICRHLGENLTPETYIKLCAEKCIGIPIIPPAYGWEP